MDIFKTKLEFIFFFGGGRFETYIFYHKLISSSPLIKDTFSGSLECPIYIVGLGLCCLTPLSTIFSYTAHIA
jgi:hypothetical protein